MTAAINRRGSLTHLEEAFASVHWFIPAYLPLGFITPLGGRILASQGKFSHDDLERELSQAYVPTTLAAMLCERYRRALVVADHAKSISEAIEAHFLGLDHIAAAGLVPVVEGIGRELLRLRGQKAKRVTNAFSALAKSSKARNVGDIGEIISMMDSFAVFSERVLYADTSRIELGDGTNRHGMTHGAYRDSDFGRPLNFYKILGAVDFLTLVSGMDRALSWLHPAATPESMTLARYYQELQTMRQHRPTASAGTP